jgi:hypothetical protein
MVKERHVSTSSLEADTRSNPIFEVYKVTKAVVVTPYWPTQYWFPMILNMKYLDHPIMMRTEKWTLAAWHLSTAKDKKKVSV